MVRFELAQESWEEGEKFNDFLTKMKKLSSTCEFGEHWDSRIRNCIIIGVQDKTLKNHLLKASDLMLEKCMKIAKANESNELQLKALKKKRTLIN